MAAATPVLDEELLDQLARIYMRAALDELLQTIAQERENDEACADESPN